MRIWQLLCMSGFFSLAAISSFGDDSQSQTEQNEINAIEKAPPRLLDTESMVKSPRFQYLKRVDFLYSYAATHSKASKADTQFSCDNPPFQSADSCFKQGSKSLHSQGCVVSTSTTSNDCQQVTGLAKKFGLSAQWVCSVKSANCKAIPNADYVGYYFARDAGVGGPNRTADCERAGHQAIMGQDINTIVLQPTCLTLAPTYGSDAATGEGRNRLPCQNSNDGSTECRPAGNGR